LTRFTAIILTRDQIDELVEILRASIEATADDLVREGIRID
jgi:hypothetical protein